MTDPSDADLLFLPWIRRGAAAAVLQPDSFTTGQPALATTSVSVQINSGQSVSVPITVMGPGHVTSLDSRQIIRTDPAAGSRTFEPNYFPLIEFDEPSLPWLFTPAGPGAQHRLRPWLCLIVVRKQNGVSVDPPARGTLPVLHIFPPAVPAAELPDLADSWAWAHAAVTTASGTAEADLVAELAANPERSVARLLCSRVLVPDTDYIACVVPTFEVGRLAGLGLDVTAEDEASLAAAWQLSATTVELPVYYSWDFATGAGGDFQSLATLLRARPLPPGVGVTFVDVSQSGLPAALPPTTTLPLAGALVPLGISAGGWSTPTLRQAWETALTPVLNVPATVTASHDPILAPPRYGAAQGKLSLIDPNQPHRWFEQLNLFPPYRAIAHLGTRVVQDLQDQLMASAWDQAADLTKANELLRQNQFGCLVTTSLHTRHLARMDPGIGLQVLSPAHARVTRTPTGEQFAAMLRDTGLNTPDYSTALRRVARARGPIDRRLQRADPSRALTDFLLSLQPISRSRSHVAFPTKHVSLELIGQRVTPPRFDITWDGATGDAVRDADPSPWFAFAPMGTPVPFRRPPGVPPGQWPDSAAATVFRSAAAKQLARFNPIRSIPDGPPLPDGSLTAAFAEGLARTAPAEAFATQARAMVVVPGAADADPLNRVNLAPSFPQPMAEALADVAQDLMLPGLDLVPPNTVVPVETNQKFVEAYLVGLNTEMARELLWRQYPVDASATYFTRFWDATVAPGRPADIPDIGSWGTRSLGATESQGALFVMIIRSELLLRYPDAVIYATNDGAERDPIFTGRFTPDVRYVGFDILADEINDWSFVIQEHPSAPRFGIEVGTATGTVTHLPAPGADSAHTAQQLRQLPVRLTIPAAVLLRTA